MDLVYMPEMLAYGSFRLTHYRDYEQPWNANYFSKHGTTVYEQHCQRLQQAKSSSKSCDLCKENKRRSLASYIKQKSSQHNKKICSRICEEEEETEEVNRADQDKNSMTKKEQNLSKST